MNEKETTLSSPAGAGAASPPPPPTRIQIGGLILLRTDAVAEEWGLTTEQFHALLDVIQVPIMRLAAGHGDWVSVYPLEYALFVLGLPGAMKCRGGVSGGCDATVVDVHYQMASLLYGTLTREAVRERVRALAKAVGKDLKLAPKRGRPSQKGRNVVDRDRNPSYNEKEEN